MPSTIGNPLSWGAKNVNAAGHGLAEAVRQTGGDHSKADPVLRPIGLNDIRAALKAGLRDFLHFRSDVMAACLLYPIIGLGLIGASAHRGTLPLIFPILSGFALVGPIAAIGLYELSRRRERGEPAAWSDMMRVTSAPGFGGIVMLSAGLACWYFLWLISAWFLHALTMGQSNYADTETFLQAVLATPGGWGMMALGIPLGFLFAVVALAVSILSFPLLVDREIGLPRAVVCSFGLFRQSPVAVLAWGAVVVAGLVLGALPMLLGLAVTLPILGHATWHLYRRAVV